MGPMVICVVQGRPPARLRPPRPRKGWNNPIKVFTESAAQARKVRAAIRDARYSCRTLGGFLGRMRLLKAEFHQEITERQSTNAVCRWVRVEARKRKVKELLTGVGRYFIVTMPIHAGQALCVFAGVLSIAVCFKPLRLKALPGDRVIVITASSSNARLFPPPYKQAVKEIPPGRVKLVAIAKIARLSPYFEYHKGAPYRPDQWYVQNDAGGFIAEDGSRYALRARARPSVADDHVHEDDLAGSALLCNSFWVADTALSSAPLLPVSFQGGCGAPQPTAGQISAVKDIASSL